MANKLFILLIIIFSISAKAQTERKDKLYSMTGIGFSFPMGGAADYLKPKFSTSLGFNLGIGNGGLFLYPKVSLHAFGFNEITPDPGFNYTLQKSRATTYLLNIGLGYRKIVNNWGFYGFAGAGGGFILTPQVFVNNTSMVVTMHNKSNWTGIIETGVGIEYNVGGANLFIETSYMYGTNHIQNRSYNIVPLTVGVKPNLSKLLNKL